MKKKGYLLRIISIGLSLCMLATMFSACTEKNIGTEEDTKYADLSVSCDTDRVSSLSKSVNLKFTSEDAAFKADMTAADIVLTDAFENFTLQVVSAEKQALTVKLEGEIVQSSYGAAGYGTIVLMPDAFTVDNVGCECSIKIDYPSANIEMDQLQFDKGDLSIPVVFTNCTMQPDASVTRMKLLAADGTDPDIDITSFTPAAENEGVLTIATGKSSIDDAITAVNGMKINCTGITQEGDFDFSLFFPQAGILSICDYIMNNDGQTSCDVTLYVDAVSGSIPRLAASDLSFTQMLKDASVISVKEADGHDYEIVLTLPAPLTEETEVFMGGVELKEGVLKTRWGTPAGAQSAQVIYDANMSKGEKWEAVKNAVSTFWDSYGGTVSGVAEKLTSLPSAIVSVLEVTKVIESEKVKLDKIYDYLLGMKSQMDTIQSQIQNLSNFVKATAWKNDYNESSAFWNNFYLNKVVELIQNTESYSNKQDAFIYNTIAMAGEVIVYSGERTTGEKMVTAPVDMNENAASGYNRIRITDRETVSLKGTTSTGKSINTIINKMNDNFKNTNRYLYKGVLNELEEFLEELYPNDKEKASFAFESLLLQAGYTAYLSTSKENINIEKALTDLCNALAKSTNETAPLEHFYRLLTMKYNWETQGEQDREYVVSYLSAAISNALPFALSFAEFGTPGGSTSSLKTLTQDAENYLNEHTGVRTEKDKAEKGFVYNYVIGKEVAVRGIDFAHSTKDEYPGYLDKGSKKYTYVSYSVLANDLSKQGATRKVDMINFYIRMNMNVKYFNDQIFSEADYTEMERRRKNLGISSFAEELNQAKLNYGAPVDQGINVNGRMVQDLTKARFAAGGNPGRSDTSYDIATKYLKADSTAPTITIPLTFRMPVDRYRSIPDPAKIKVLAKNAPKYLYIFTDKDKF